MIDRRKITDTDGVTTYPAREERTKSLAVEATDRTPEYIDPRVENLRGSKSPIEVTLLIGVSGDYNNDTVCKLVEQAGGTVDAEIGRATLRVTAPETAIESLCTLDGDQIDRA